MEEVLSLSAGLEMVHLAPNQMVPNPGSSL